MTERERYDVICALEIAMEQYERDARIMHDNGNAGLGKQFDEQAKRAEALIDKFS